MTRPTASLTLDALLASGSLDIAYRVLTTALAWPAGDPPFADDHVRVRDWPLPAAIAHYDAATFEPAAWTDGTALVESYQYTQQAELQTDQLSLSVPAPWGATELNAVFGEMRVIVVQERYRGAGGDTGWLNRCWCLSDGCRESWADGVHRFVVEAKDALKLAGLDLLGAADGALTLQPDLVQMGTPGAHRALALVGADVDAWEYGFVTGPYGGMNEPLVDHHLLYDDDADFSGVQVGAHVAVYGIGGMFSHSTVVELLTAPAGLRLADPIAGGMSQRYYVGGIQPSWSDLPAPQLWIENCPHSSDPVPATVAGDALQLVYGEGTLRLGKLWCAGNPDSAGGHDFTRGVGLDGPPLLKGLVWRFAHPAVLDRDNYPAPADIARTDADGAWLRQLDDPPVAGRVTVAGDYAGCPPGLTLVGRDGAGRRYTTVSHQAANGVTVFTLANTTALVPTGAAFSYGDANLATDVVWRLLLGCGYQTADPAAPLYLAPPAPPLLPAELGGQQEIALPPQVYRDTDGLTALRALEELRRNGFVPPNWYVRATADGQIVAGSVLLNAEDARPLAALTTLDCEQTDLAIATRVVARGRWRLVPNLLHDPARQLVEHEGDAGWLPNPATVQLPGSSISAHHCRQATAAPNYCFPLDRLTGGTPLTADLGNLAPWMWSVRHADATPWESYLRLWRGATLCEFHFPANVLNAVELVTACSFPYSGLVIDLRHLGASAPARLALDYFDLGEGAWHPLALDIPCAISLTDTHRLDAEQFATRGAVETTGVRLRCVEPFTAVSVYHDDAFHLYGVWLSQVRLWASPEVRGAAELGDAANYGGELAASPWPERRAALRRRTYVLPDAVPWVTSVPLAQWLALEWLKDKARDLAPRRAGVIRPDVRLWDTVRLAGPADPAPADYLVVGVQHGHEGVSTITAVGY